MQLTILGTSCSIPTIERNTAGYYLQLKNDGILLDCGEGIQRQMKKFGIKLSKVSKILITHWHGDHVLGLGGLLQSFNSLENTNELEIYGPKGSKEYYEHLRKSLAFEMTIKIKIKEVNKGIIFKNNNFFIETLPMRHRITCLAYSITEQNKRRINLTKTKKIGIPEGPLLGKLQQGKSIKHDGKTIKPDDVSSIVKGKKFTYITDTAMNDNAYTIAEEADVLLSEAVFEHTLIANARKTKHLTAKQAGNIASRAGAKKLVLTHFSARYKETSILEQEARECFDNVVSGHDGMKISI